jgi:hypothetical protein
MVIARQSLTLRDENSCPKNIPASVSLLYELEERGQTVDNVYDALSEDLKDTLREFILSLKFYNGDIVGEE